MNQVLFRLRLVGAVVLAVGLIVAGLGFLYVVPTADAGLDAAQKTYEAQGVALSFNDAGELVDRGTVEGADRILALLRDDWDFPISRGDFDASDPIVNTRAELMFQYATVTYHVLHGEQTVTLTAEQVPITYRGVTYSQPGEYAIEVGAYYAQFDRSHPIEGQLRNAWSPLALAITGNLAAAHANQAAGELAMGTGIAIGGIGLLFGLAGGGLMWVSFAHPRPRSAEDKLARRDASEDHKPARPTARHGAAGPRHP